MDIQEAIIELYRMRSSMLAEEFSAQLVVNEGIVGRTIAGAVKGTTRGVIKGMGVGAIVGAVGGGLATGTKGAILGSALGPIGTVAGGMLGGALGVVGGMQAGIATGGILGTVGGGLRGTVQGARGKEVKGPGDLLGNGAFGRTTRSLIRKHGAEALGAAIGGERGRVVGAAIGAAWNKDSGDGDAPVIPKAAKTAEKPTEAPEQPQGEKRGWEKTAPPPPLPKLPKATRPKPGAPPDVSPQPEEDGEFTDGTLASHLLGTARATIAAGKALGHKLMGKKLKESILELRRMKSNFMAEDLAVQISETMADTVRTGSKIVGAIAGTAAATGTSLATLGLDPTDLVTAPLVHHAVSGGISALGDKIADGLEQKDEPKDD